MRTKSRNTTLFAKYLVSLEYLGLDLYK